MESSKEKIEAQLCAYVEGELDEADRADIERHLQTNPQHKALIAELRRHRDLLQTLPRATIPGDLNENLTGQLERSALLSDDDETAEAGVRINRWPQLTAVAAVLVLAAGLGIVVFYVLPAGSKHGPMASAVNDTAAARRAPAASEPARGDLLADKQTSPTTRPNLGRDDTLASAASPDGLIRGRTPSSDLPATPPPAAAPTASNESKSAALGAPAGALGPAAVDQKAILRELTAGPGLVTPGEVEELQRRMTRTLGGEANAQFHLDPRNSLYLVVQTNDPVAANGEVTAYFKTNNIQYMNAAADLIDFDGKPVAVAQAGAQDTDKAAETTPGTGAYGGGVSSITRLEARGFGAEPNRQQAGGGQFGGGGGAGGFGGGRSGGGSVASTPAPAGAETKTGLADARGGTYGRGAQLEPQRRVIAREPNPPAGAAAAASQPYVALSGSRDAAVPLGGAGRSTDAEAPLQQKAKLDGSAIVGQRSAESAQAKDALTLNAPRPSAAPSDLVKHEALVERTVPQTGQEPATGRNRTAGAAAGVAGAPTWEMRANLQAAPAGERAATPGGVIVARMNRRQAGELGTLLSRDQGQRAELRDFAGFNNTLAGVPITTPTATDPTATIALGDTAATTTDRAKTPTAAGKPATPDRGEASNKQSASTPADEALRLTPKPQDEPVDVVIVLKPATAASTPPAAAKPDTDSKK